MSVGAAEYRFVCMHAHMYACISACMGTPRGAVPAHVVMQLRPLRGRRVVQRAYSPHLGILEGISVYDPPRSPYMPLQPLCNHYIPPKHEV